MNLNDLKIAVINRDLKKLKTLSKEEVEFSSLKEAQEILSYIQKAQEILEEEKKSLLKDMDEIKKLKKFYHSSQKRNLNFKI